MRRTAYLLVLFVNILSFNAQSSQLTADDYAQLPDVQKLALAPNGKKLASMIRVDVPQMKGTAVQVTNLDTGKSNIVLFTDNTKYFLNHLKWKDEKTLLVFTWYPSKRDTWTGMARVHGDTRETRLLIVNTETGEVNPPFKVGFLKKYKYLPSGLGTVINMLPDKPDHILMRVPGLSDGWPVGHAVVDVNIKKRSARFIQKRDPSTSGWETDKQGRVRFGWSYNDGKTFDLSFKDVKKNQWDNRWTYIPFSAQSTEFSGFDYDPNIVYLEQYKNGYSVISKADLRDPSNKTEIVFSRENADASGKLIFSKKRQKLIGIDQGRSHPTRFIDDEWREIQAKIDKALPKRNNNIFSITDDENKFLVFSNSPTESGTYYIGSRSPLKLEPAGYSYKKLTTDKLSDVLRTSFTARDGTQIEAHLTLPKGATKKLPTLVFPHGGPFARTEWEFDIWAQFFSSMGYAVIQPNFRGSAGYGLNFTLAGLREWGKAMQEDVEDTVAEIVKRGIADPKQICIVGASYGGYAALVGVSKTPDLYRCAISVNGVTDLLKLVDRETNIATSYDLVDEYIGDDRADLAANSPVKLVDNIKVPVLLIHGEKDRQVDVTHGRQMYYALRDAKKDVIYIEQENEDHYISGEHSRIEAFRAMADFLNKSLPVR